MGDTDFVTLLSMVPLLTIVASLVVAAVAWRSGRRWARTMAAILLLVAGSACILSTAGMLFSIPACAVIGLLAVALLVVEYGPRGGA